MVNNCYSWEFVGASRVLEEVSNGEVLKFSLKCPGGASVLARQFAQGSTFKDARVGDMGDSFVLTAAETGESREQRRVLARGSSPCSK